MIVWFLQVREDSGHLDTLVPLGDKLPDWTRFSELLEKTSIKLPQDFQQGYFNPAIHALKREMEKPGEWYYVAFNVEGTHMAIQGLDDTALHLKPAEKTNVTVTLP
jgi:hypothetical protein